VSELPKSILKHCKSHGPTRVFSEEDSKRVPLL
jgi:hypothetical protein